MFSQSVVENIGHYVYCLIDPRNKKVFYIGKGCGNRVFDHVSTAIEGDMPGMKLDTIREISKQGLEVSHYILRHGLTEEMAFEIESTLIDFLTFKGFNLESLLTNIVAGHHSWDRGIKSIDEISTLYDCKDIIPNPNDRIICININKTFVNGERSDIYDATRHYWKMSITRACKATHVLSIYRGIVRAVFVPEKWYTSPQFNHQRIEFEGRQIFDSPYLNTKISNVVKCGQNPINYINL